MKGTASKGFSGDQWITGTLLFDATMVGPGNVQGSYNIHVNTLIDNSTGINGGAFQGSTALHITGSTPFNRDTLIVNTLYFDHGQTVRARAQPRHELHGRRLQLDALRSTATP